VRQNSLKGMRG